MWEKTKNSASHKPVVQIGGGCVANIGDIQHTPCYQHEFTLKQYYRRTCTKKQKHACMPMNTPWDAMHSACFTTLKPTKGT